MSGAFAIRKSVWTGRAPVHDAGVFWLFAPDASSNSAYETRVFPTVSLYVHGDENVLADNVISCSHAASVVMKGDRNALLNNIVDSDVIVDGSGNTISCLAFTTPEARLILRGEGNRVWGVPPERISGACT